MSKRRWFQIPLSSAIVSMIVASLLLALNLRTYTIGTPYNSAGILIILLRTGMGWPFCFRESDAETAPQYFPHLLMLNVVVGISILVIVTFLFEAAVRRLRSKP